MSSSYIFTGPNYVITSRYKLNLIAPILEMKINENIENQLLKNLTRKMTMNFLINVIKVPNIKFLDSLLDYEIKKKKQSF